jgi:hypothetical protein
MAFLAEVAALSGYKLDGNLYISQGMKEEPVYRWGQIKC